MQEKNKNVIYGRYRGTFLKDNCKTNLGENSNTKNRKRRVLMKDRMHTMNNLNRLDIHRCSKKHGMSHVPSYIPLQHHLEKGKVQKNLC
jgi:hypothetical protein